MIGRATQWLVLGNVVAAAALVALWSWGQTRWQPPAPIAIDPQLLATQVAQAAPAAAYQRERVLARPLLLESRRPLPEGDLPADAQAASPPADALAAARVLGVVGDGQDGLVILRSGDRTWRIATGALFEGRRLLELTQEHIVFEDEAGVRRVLDFIRPRPAITAPQPPAAVTPPADP